MVVAFLVKNGSLIMRKATFHDLMVPPETNALFEGLVLVPFEYFANKGLLLAHSGPHITRGPLCAKSGH